MLRVTVWNEFLHEKESARVRELHPNGLHETIAQILRKDPEIVVRTATLQDPECGLTEEVLRDTDVLFWWGHMNHRAVPDEVVDRVCRHVHCGMGLVALHSSHFSKVFKKLMGTPCNLKWHDDARERVFVSILPIPLPRGFLPTSRSPRRSAIASRSASPSRMKRSLWAGTTPARCSAPAAATTVGTAASSTSSRATKPTPPSRCRKLGRFTATPPIGLHR